MKRSILIASLALAASLTACGGGSDYTVPQDAPKATHGPQLRPCEAPEAPCPAK